MTTIALPLNVIRSVASISKTVESNRSKVERDATPNLSYTRISVLSDGGVDAICTNRYTIARMVWTPEGRHHATAEVGSAIYVHAETFTRILAAGKGAPGDAEVLIRQEAHVPGEAREDGEVAVFGSRLTTEPYVYNFPPVDRLLGGNVVDMPAGVLLAPWMLAGLATMAAPGETTAQAKLAPWAAGTVEGDGEITRRPVQFRREFRHAALTYMVQPNMKLR